MFFAKKITAEEAEQLGANTWEPWVGEPNKGTWHVEETGSFLCDRR